MTISIFIMGISITLSGILSKELFIVFAVGSLIMGFSGPIAQATITTVFAEQIDATFLGRVYSNYMSLMVIVMPLGLFLSGIFADVIGINIWFFITGILMLCMALFIRFNKISFEKPKE